MLYVERVLGSLLGAAIGDALGAPVESSTLAEIRLRFGPHGISGFAPAHGREGGAVTGETQLALFTAEAMIHAAKQAAPCEAHLREALHLAYLRWFATQGATPPADVAPPAPQPIGPGCDPPACRLERLASWCARRSPGTTCLSALATGRCGTVYLPLNQSTSSDGVARVAPLGLALRGDSFNAACEAAAITHGHPTGYLPAGFLALALRRLVEGRELEPALHAARRELARWSGHRETLDAVDRAIVATTRKDYTPETIEKLGAGWTADEALGIAVYCALRARDVDHGLLLAVNHGGDSSTTGAMTGSLLGALWGVDALPATWVRRLELRELVTDTAWELARVLG